MISLFAIIKLTFKSAIRSRIFWLLLAVLMACTILIPLTISGDGTAWGFIQVSLKYTLGIIGFILSLSTIWLSCFIVTQDVESYQLHMVVSKPVSRVKIWFGKCFGVIFIHIILIIISTAVVYFLVLYQFNAKSFSAKEKLRIENEVLVGRKAFMPVMPDVNKIVVVEYKRRLKVLKDNGADIQNVLKNEARMLSELKREFLAKYGEVGPGMVKYWQYKGIDPELNAPLFLRYKPYVGKVSPQKTQRNSMGMWGAQEYLKKPIMVPLKKNGEAVDAKAIAEENKMRKNRSIHRIMRPLSSSPESINCGVYNELLLPPSVVQPDGTVVVSFANFDLARKPIFFQQADGPKLLIRQTGFWNNYARAVLMLVLRIIFLAGLSCAVAGFVSMPVAIFSVIAYILIGFFANYLVGSEDELIASGAGLEGLQLVERFGGIVSRILLIFVIPMQNFEVSDIIAGGELIEWHYIARVFFNFFILRGLPFILIGVYVYWRREMGLVIKR